LVPDGRESVPALTAAGPAGDDGEIRLTYRELSTLVEQAIRNLR
jgi:hypothetical protein